MNGSAFARTGGICAPTFLTGTPSREIEEASIGNVNHFRKSENAGVNVATIRELLGHSKIVIDNGVQQIVKHED